MTIILLPFLILSAAGACACCIAIGYRGLAFAGMLLVFFAAGFFALLLALLVCIAIISIFIDVTKPQRRRDTFFQWLTGYVMGLVTVLSRIRLHVSGLEKIPEGRWLLVCNHRSNYDPIVAGWVLRRRGIAFISKPENLKIPVVGPVIHKACYLSIDREDDRAAIRTIQESADLICRNVVSFGIFPEGTRSHSEEMLPFRNGAFKIAQKAHVPIVVAAIRGTEKVKDNFPWRATDVYFEICEVIGAEEAAAMKTTEIGEKVRTCITCANS